MNSPSDKCDYQCRLDPPSQGPGHKWPGGACELTPAMQAPGRPCRWTCLPSPSAREAASMYGTAVAIFLVILVAALQGSAPPESPFPYHIPLDPEGALELSWNVSYVQKAIHFQLLVHGLKAGVLFGMSDRGELENADLVVLWTNGDSAYFAVSPSSLPPGSLHLTPDSTPGPLPTLTLFGPAREVFILPLSVSVCSHLGQICVPSLSILETPYWGLNEKQVLPSVLVCTPQIME